MKLNDLQEAKRLDSKTLLERVKTLRGEIADLVLDKNMDKLKDLKAISKKKKDMAKYLTILRQKELLDQFSKVQEAVSEEEKDEKKTKKSDKEEVKS
jgi:ribosomal protein L29